MYGDSYKDRANEGEVEINRIDPETSQKIGQTEREQNLGLFSENEGEKREIPLKRKRGRPC